MRFTLGVTGLYDRFEGRTFSARGSSWEPAPDLFLHAAKAMGVQPTECAEVEDSHAGVVAARAAGMHVFGYAGGLTSAERLRTAGAVVFAEMRELPDLLQELVES
jgi:beta-phosphoglucomutase-like phosphatase (HAD superfamily)